MSGNVARYRVVKTITRAPGSGIKESFWEVQRRRAFRWWTLSVYPTSWEANADAIKRASDE